MVVFDKHVQELLGLGHQIPLRLLDALRRQQVQSGHHFSRALKNVLQVVGQAVKESSQPDLEAFRLLRYHRTSAASARASLGRAESMRQGLSFPLGRF